MRIRRKPWARPELQASDFFIQNPLDYYGKWHGLFDNNNPLHVELGCGKGGFMAELSKDHGDINYLAIDIKSEMLGLARRKIVKSHEGKHFEPKDHIRLMSQDIERITMMMAPEDRVERVYINFCNPWPRRITSFKKRLTHTRQLLKIRTFLQDGGEVWFKTDDDELFDHSLYYFYESGFDITYLTYDLHRSDFTENIMTEHEKMFSEEGIPIKFLKAKKISDKDLKITLPDPHTQSMLWDYLQRKRDEENQQSSK